MSSTITATTSTTIFFSEDEVTFAAPVGYRWNCGLMSIGYSTAAPEHAAAVIAAMALPLLKDNVC